ncbi:hypothetical protein H8E77_07570 [bacterium]|nr:hypothetical protein [bacterium]
MLGSKGLEGKRFKWCKNQLSVFLQKGKELKDVYESLAGHNSINEPIAPADWGLVKE